MNLIVSQCRSLNDMCSFKLIKPMMWDSPPSTPLPLKKKQIRMIKVPNKHPRVWL